MWCFFILFCESHKSGWCFSFTVLCVRVKRSSFLLLWTIRLVDVSCLVCAFIGFVPLQSSHRAVFLVWSSLRSTRR